MTELRRNQYNEFTNLMSECGVKHLVGNFTSRYDNLYLRRRGGRWPDAEMAEKIIKLYEHNGPLNDDRDGNTVGEEYMRDHLNMIDAAQYYFIKYMDRLYTNRRGQKRLNNQFMWYIRKEKGKYRASR